MKSSGAIFTRQNLFPPDPRVPKTHYNPSPTKKITKKHRKTNLSPVRLTKPHSLSVPQMEPLTLEDQRFHGSTFNPLPCTPPSTEPQPSFSESWPSTDHESSPANTTASPRNEALAHAAASGKFQTTFVPAIQEDSVLAKYVERFRHGRPQSREERQLSADTVEDWRPFWWLSSSSPPPSSSAPTKLVQNGCASAHGSDQLNTSPVERMRPSPPLSPHGTPLDFTVMGYSKSVVLLCLPLNSSLNSPGTLGGYTKKQDYPVSWGLLDSSHCEPSDPGMLQLQERATRLLQRSEHSLSSSSLPISSEGLGCSDLSSPVSVDEPVQRPVFSSLIDSTTVTLPALNSGPIEMPSVGALLAPRTRPEDDILFQWRLRRKMEQARQWPLPRLQGPAQVGRTQVQQGLYTSDVPTQRAAQHFTSTLQEPSQPPAPTAPPSFQIASPTASRLPPDTPIAAHMHLLCDMLPCPLRHVPPERRRRSLKKCEVPIRDPDHSPPKGRPSSTETSSEDLPSKDSSSPPPPSSETAEEQRPARGKKPSGLRKDTLQKEESERTEKRTAPSCSKKKPSRVVEGSRVDSHKRPTRAERAVTRDRVGKERVTPWPEEPRRGQWDRGQKSRKEGRPGDQAPPPSPIHNALGQVVSEVLFPTSDSPLHSRTPGSSSSPRYTPPAPPQSPAPAPSMPQAPEVVAQLLQEAEESDGLEFVDDPLLQVLRQQREWVKEQISEVDTILNEIQDV